MPPPIGIDLGTSYSRVSVFEHGGVTIIPNEKGHLKTHSCVAFSNDHGQLALIGDDVNKYRNTVYSVKRLIGRAFNEVQSDSKNFSFDVINSEGKPSIEANVKDNITRYSPQEITSMILRSMKDAAEAYIGETVHDAVITVPATFNDSQRQATMEAGEMVGLNVLYILNENYASALAHGFANRVVEDQNVMIVDLGGGKLNVTILINRVDEIVEVLAMAENIHLGGLDFDNRMVQYFIREFNQTYKKDISNDKKAMSHLRVACEQAKCTLSASTEAQNISSLIEGVDFSSRITIKIFEELCSDLFASIMDSLNRALSDSSLQKSDIHDVLLVGGSSQMPKVQQMIVDLFDGKVLNTSLNYGESVVFGAAINATILNGQESATLGDLRYFDFTHFTLDYEMFKQYGSTVYKSIDVQDVDSDSEELFERNCNTLQIDGANNIQNESSQTSGTTKSGGTFATSSSTSSPVVSRGSNRTSDSTSCPTNYGGQQDFSSTTNQQNDSI